MPRISLSESGCGDKVLQRRWLLGRPADGASPRRILDKGKPRGLYYLPGPPVLPGGRERLAMPVQSCLRRDETIQYRGPRPVEFQGEKYDFYVTNARLIWHQRKGADSRREAWVAAAKEQVTDVAYEERGFFSRKAFCRVVMGGREIIFAGKPAIIREIFAEMQPHVLARGEEK
jgi:hypothetical protein